jgi:hypothetical protein
MARGRGGRLLAGEPSILECRPQPSSKERRKAGSSAETNGGRKEPSLILLLLRNQLALALAPLDEGDEKGGLAHVSATHSIIVYVIMMAVAQAVLILHRFRGPAKRRKRREVVERWRGGGEEKKKNDH